MSKAKTDEVYRKQLAYKHPDIEALDFYTKGNVKIKVRHKICKHEWMVFPNELLRGKGCCPICSKKKPVLREIVPLLEFLRRLDEQWHGLVEYVGDYTKMSAKCWFRCTICGNVWKASPSNILRGRGCFYCSHARLIVPLNTMLEQVKEIWGDEIEYVEGYTKMSAKCKWRCKRGHEWWAEPRELVRGRGCYSCHIIDMTLPLEEVVRRVDIISNHTVEYVSGYVNTQTRCWWKCKVCGRVFFVKPNNLLNGHGCLNCIKKSLEKPILEALRKKGIESLHDVSLEGSNYNGSRMPLRVDFIIETPKGKLAIEADGSQHFLPVYGEEELKYQQEKDRYKDKYLKERGYILIRVTSSPIKKWGFENHITLDKLLNLIKICIDENGNVNLDVFIPYDFNRK